MPMKFMISPWLRVGKNHYINITKIVDVTFYEQGSKLYAICHLENGKTRVTGDEAHDLKMILDKSHVVNLFNTEEMDLLLRAYSRPIFQMACEDELLEKFTIVDLEESLP